MAAQALRLTGLRPCILLAAVSCLAFAQAAWAQSDAAPATTPTTPSVTAPADSSSYYDSQSWLPNDASPSTSSTTPPTVDCPVNPSKKAATQNKPTDCTGSAY